MSTTEIIQTYTVQPIDSPIFPASGYSLTDTFNVNPSYSTSKGELYVLMSFMIPKAVDPSQVAIKQYYNPEQSGQLDFYAVYSSASTDPYQQVNCKFKASPVDAAGNPIALASILNVMTMVVCTVGPKTSRGVKTNVRVTGE